MSYQYHAMSNFFNRDNVGLTGFAAFYRVSSLEERTHAQQLMDYQVRHAAASRRIMLAQGLPSMRWATCTLHTSWVYMTATYPRMCGVQQWGHDISRHARAADRAYEAHRAGGLCRPVWQNASGPCCEPLNHLCRQSVVGA